MISLGLVFFYYWIILFSIIGYGLLFSKFFLLKSNENDDIGYVGLYGIFSLLLISYFSSFLVPHTLFFNSIIIGIGFLYFWISKQKFFLSNNFKILIFVFSILLIAIYAAKNHDDFPYYHFPYAHILTEHSGLIGIGNFNHGFRTPSSILYLSSLFYLPFIKYFLFHITPVFFLGFANLVLYKKIKENLKEQKNLYIIFLSLFSLVLINIFFYRIGEHGTDRSAMILIMILVIEIMYLINFEKIYEKNRILKLLILISIIFSLKAFYIIYCILFFLIFFYYVKKKELILFLIKDKVVYLCVGLILIVLATNFLNSGCTIYPAKFLCNENFQWAIPLSEVELMNNWYQQWSKAGAGPNFSVEDPEKYIQHFNWVANWFQMYFFNKVSDFLLGLLLVILIFIITFLRKKKKLKKKKFIFLYIILLILFFEWFYYHPALRYGGYNLLALLVFIPVSLFLENYLGNQLNFQRKVNIILIVVIVIFSLRNVQRINKEYKVYNYNLFTNAYYKEFQQNFSINEDIERLILCIDNKSDENCKKEYFRSRKILNSYMFYRKK